MIDQMTPLAQGIECPFEGWDVKVTWCKKKCVESEKCPAHWSHKRPGQHWSDEQLDRFDTVLTILDRTTFWDYECNWDMWYKLNTDVHPEIKRQIKERFLERCMHSIELYEIDFDNYVSCISARDGLPW